MKPKLLELNVIEKLRKGAKNEQGYALRKARPVASVRCRCCGEYIERGDRALYIHLILAPPITFGVTCWIHERVCDPSLAGDEKRHDILDPVA